MDDLYRDELPWDAEITDESECVTLPEGDYEFEIDHYERARHAGSDKIPPCNKAIVYFRIKSEDGKEVTIQENYLLHRKLEWKLSELFRGVGLKNKDETIRMDWNALPGLKGKAYVIIVSGMNNPDAKYNRIKKIYPYEKKQYKGGMF